MPDNALYREPVSLLAIRRCKKDVLVEAADDLFHLCHLLEELAEELEIPLERALDASHSFVREMIALGLVQLATWCEESHGHIRPAELADSELRRHLAAEDSDYVFEYFLIATDRGNAWADRYEALLQELVDPALLPNTAIALPAGNIGHEESEEHRRTKPGDP